MKKTALVILSTFGLTLLSFQASADTKTIYVIGKDGGAIVRFDFNRIAGNVAESDSRVGIIEDIEPVYTNYYSLATKAREECIPIVAAENIVMSKGTSYQHIDAEEIISLAALRSLKNSEDARRDSCGIDYLPVRLFWSYNGGENPYPPVRYNSKQTAQ